MIRTGSASGTQAVLDWLIQRGRWLCYSVGMAITDEIHAAVEQIPKRSCTPVCDADRQVRSVAWVAETTDVVDLTGWPGHTPDRPQVNVVPVPSCGSLTSTGSA